MYLDEIGDFLRGIEDNRLYPDILEKDIKVLEILEVVKNSDNT